MNGYLKNGNSTGDFTKSPRCGAKTKSKGEPCKAPAMKNKYGKYTRCRLHGGASTGPKTKKGLEICRKANLKHGLYTKEYQEKKRRLREYKRLNNEYLKVSGKIADTKSLLNYLLEKEAIK